MELKTILRFEKIKDYNNLNLSNAHVYRYLETPNANPKISNKKLLGSGNVVRDVKCKFEKNNITPRKNAVLCIEAVLSLSPDFFQSNTNTKDFAINARKWLISEFGDNLVSAVLHLDEKTPHIHAHIVPMTDDGRLSARELFNKSTLPDYQKSYLNQMKKIETKLKYNQGSKAEHTKLKDYYSMVNKEIENNKELKDNVSKLENELEEKEDQIFFMGNKLKKLEKSIKEQNNDISNLKQFIEQLKDKIKKLSNPSKPETEPDKQEYEYQHLFPELNPNNFPDEVSESKDKKRKRNRLRR
ncbi:plasmid recombination protein [Vibrio parahaemolyticus]|uniref:MobV family relaxase n=1 Tax=Vibrio parahaemolyticus TaxID=670 RepID=UPI001EEF5694|nr:MobV family relaxase [Vibrio parahaemolyticus]MCG0026142.1 plasmid recombination protein [Vibrio parahaemolyticus]